MKRKMRESDLCKKRMIFSLVNIDDGTLTEKISIQFNNQMTKVHGFKVEYINVSPKANFTGLGGNTGSEGSIILCHSSKLSGCSNRKQSNFLAYSDFVINAGEVTVGEPVPSIIGVCVVNNYTGAPTLFNAETKAHDDSLNNYYEFYHPCDLDAFDFYFTDTNLQPLTVENSGVLGTKCAIELIISFYVEETK